MTDAKTHLDIAFGLLKQIYVNEDNVDKMYFAKQEILTAYKLLDEPEKKPETKKG